MRSMFTRVLFVLAVAALPALPAMAADNSVGTWKANIAKCKYSPGPLPLKSYTLVRDAAPGGIKVTVTGERTDGTPISSNYTAKYDGSASAVTGAGTPYDSVAIKQVDADTFTTETKNSTTKYRSSLRTVVSHDGKTMTITGKGTNADGKPMTLTLVLEEQ